MGYSPEDMLLLCECKHKGQYGDEGGGSHLMPQCSRHTFNSLLVLYSGMAIDARSRYQEEKGWGLGFICDIFSCAHHCLELYANIGWGIAIWVKYNASKTQCNAIVELH